MTLVVKDGNGNNQNLAAVVDANSELQQVTRKLIGGGYTAVQVSIDTSSSGDQTLVAAAGVGNKIYVLAYMLVVSAAVSLKWKSAATSRSGAMPFGANGGANPVGSLEVPLFWTNANEALILNIGGAGGTQVSGHLTYVVST